MEKMINLKDVRKFKDVKHHLVLEASKPVTMEFKELDSGMVVAYVYDKAGKELDENTEPIFVYSTEESPRVKDLRRK